MPGFLITDSLIDKGHKIMNIFDFDFDNPYWDHYDSLPFIIRALRNAGYASGTNPVKTDASTKPEKKPSGSNSGNWRDKLFEAEHPYRDNYNISVKRDANNAVTSYKIYTVYAPYKKSDVEVQVESDRIIINIGFKVADEKKDSSEEIVFTRYARSPSNFSIPFEDIVRDKNEEIDVDHISARTDDGVLEITVPIIRKTVSRKVKLD